MKRGNYVEIRGEPDNRPVDDNIETIDLTQNSDESPIPEKIDRIEFLSDDTRNPEIIEKPSQSIYTITITKLFPRIEQYLLIVRYSKENQIDNLPNT